MEEVEEREVPPWEGKGEERWGEEVEVAVLREWGLSGVWVDSSWRRRRLIASSSSHTFEGRLLSLGGSGDSVFS